MADWDWSTWMLVLGGVLICFLLVASALVILVLVVLAGRRDPKAQD